MNRKTAIVPGFILLLSLAASAQSVVPLPDCCPRIYDTGRWLGWATALLQYSCDLESYAAQEEIVRCLDSAGQSAEAAYRACSSGVPAWAAWRQRQLWLDTQIAELRHPGNSTKSRRMRWQLVASAIATAYEQWAEILSWEKIDGQIFKRKTCATCFFQLGFDLAGATQAYRLSLAVNADRGLSTTKRMQITLRELNRTRLRLKKSLIVLDAYRAAKRRNAGVSGCPDFGEADLEQRIRAITLEAPSMVRASEELRFVSDRSDGVGLLLAQNCVVGGARPGQPATEPARPPRDEGELAGEWEFHSTGWNDYIGPEWQNRWSIRANEIRSQALVIRFTRLGNGEYQGFIQRQPLLTWPLLPFDAFGKRTHLYRPGLRILTLRKVGPNTYRGTHQQLGIPNDINDPERAWGFYYQNCAIAVFGEAAKLVSPAYDSQPQLLEHGQGAGFLLQRASSGH
jgi:hypothetical protein